MSTATSLTPGDLAAALAAVKAAPPLTAAQITELRALIAPTLRRVTTVPADTRPANRRRAA